MASPKTAWFIPAVAVLSLLGLFSWQLGVFNLAGSTFTTPTVTGFPRIKPQLVLMSVLTNGSVGSTFTNGAGGVIRIVSVTGTSQGVSCSGGSFSTPPTNTIGVGENFKISGTCPGVYLYGSYVGDPYEVNIVLTYEVNLGGKTVTHTDSGTMRGPLEGGSGGYYRSGSGGYGSIGYRGGYYGVHKSFDFGQLWGVVVLLGVIFLLVVYKRLSGLNASYGFQLAGLYAFIFLYCSTLIFIFGVDYFSNTAIKSGVEDVPMRLRYGWVIESCIYFIVGSVLAAITEYLARMQDTSKRAVSHILSPIVSVLVLSLVFVYPYRAVTSIMDYDGPDKVLQMGWTVGVLFIALAGVSLFLTTKLIAHGTPYFETPEILYYTKNISALFFIAAAGFFIWGVNAIVYSRTDLDVRGVLISVFIFVGGVVLMSIGVAKKEDTRPPAAETKDRKHGLVHSLIVVAVVIWILKNLAGLLYIRGSYQLLFLGILCGAFLAWYLTSRKTAQ